MTSVDDDLDCADCNVGLVIDDECEASDPPLCHHCEKARLLARAERAARAARNWKLAAKALRSLAIMAGVRKSFYRPYSLRRWTWSAIGGGT